MPSINVGSQRPREHLRVSYTPRMSGQAWELIFMMLILKIPIVYLGLVVWYAIKAEPEPGVDPSEYSVWRPVAAALEPAAAARRAARDARLGPRRACAPR